MLYTYCYSIMSACFVDWSPNCGEDFQPSLLSATCVIVMGHKYHLYLPDKDVSFGNNVFLLSTGCSVINIDLAKLIYQYLAIQSRYTCKTNIKLCIQQKHKINIKYK